MKFCCPLLFAHYAENHYYVPQNREFSNILKRKEQLTTYCLSASVRNQRCWRDYQVMNNAESELKHFWITADQRWLSLRRQPGILLVHNKILAINTIFANFFKNTSCKFLATIWQHFFISCKNFARVVSCKNAIFVRILQNLARNKLSLNTLRSDNLCISPKSKRIQSLEVKFDEIYTYWTHYVIERVWKHQGWGIFWNDMFCNGLICLNRNTKRNNFFPTLPNLVLLVKIIPVVF